MLRVAEFSKREGCVRVLAFERAKAESKTRETFNTLAT